LLCLFIPNFKTNNQIAQASIFPAGFNLFAEKLSFVGIRFLGAAQGALLRALAYKADENDFDDIRKRTWKILSGIFFIHFFVKEVMRKSLLLFSAVTGNLRDDLSFFCNKNLSEFERVECLGRVLFRLRARNE